MHPQESESWFSKKLSAELVNEFYKSAEKFPKDPKWPSNLKVKLPFDKKGAPQFVVYDEKKKGFWTSYHDHFISADFASSLLVSYQHWLFYPIMAVARFNLYIQGDTFF